MAANLHHLQGIRTLLSSTYPINPIEINGGDICKTD